MIKEIQSVNNPYIKDLSKLKEKKYRNLNKRYIIEGYHLVKEAYLKKVLKEVLYINEIDIKDFNNTKVNLIKVNKEVINKLSDTTNPQNIIGICEIKEVDVDYKDYNYLLILDAINDPGNLGTLIRTALGFNIDLIVASNDTVDLYNSKSIRATQGAMFALPIIYKDLNLEIEKIKESGIKIIGTSLNASTTLKELNKLERYAIILGNEARGVKENLLENTDVNVIIETNKLLESLNVSIAGAIMMYELNNKLSR